MNQEIRRKLDRIVANEYNLAAGRYKPQVAGAAIEEDPAELIEETLSLKREIISGLKKLLAEVKAL